MPELAKGNAVRFQYNGFHREGIVEKVGNGYVTLKLTEGDKSYLSGGDRYRSFKVGDIANVTRFPYGWEHV